jgi:nucleotide-binding universal stress UspA family protein
MNSIADVDICKQGCYPTYAPHNSYSTDLNIITPVKKILMPIDRSEYKKKILAYAFSLSKAWNADVTALHVIDVGGRVGYSRDEETKLERIQKARKPAEELLNEIDLMAKKQGFHIEKEVIQGNNTVGKTIIDYGKKNKMDLIVIGTKGMTAVEEYFFGSVAKEVLRYSHCPVFAIR